MSGTDHESSSFLVEPMSRRWCPSWCVSRHGVADGEEDWVHVGEPLTLTGGVVAQLCMSVEPASGAVNGPYVVIGSSEFTLAEAESLGVALTAMARLASGVTPPGAGGRHSRGRSR